MCCAGQPLILVGDLNADPSVISCLAKGMSDGAWIDVERAFAMGKGVAPTLTCQFQLDEDKGSRRDFALACPVAMAATTAWLRFARSLVSPAFCNPHGFLSFRLGRHCRNGQGLLAPLASLLARSLQTLQRFRTFGTFTSKSSAREAEASLARAYLTAGGPALSRPSSYVGRGHLSLRTERLGGRCKDRIYRMDHADEFDVTNSGFFVNSYLAPVLRFRRRFMSVCNVFKDIKTHGFTDTRVFCTLVPVGCCY